MSEYYLIKANAMCVVFQSGVAIGWTPTWKDADDICKLCEELEWDYADEEERVEYETKPDFQITIHDWEFAMLRPPIKAPQGAT